MVSKYWRKNHSTANRSIYICPIFPKKRFRVWVAAAPFKFSLPSMLPVFTKYIPAFFTATYHYRRFTVVIYLSSFVEGSETTEPCRLYRVKNCYKLCSFWRFVDTRPIVWPRLRTHFADILNSQLMYTVQLLNMIKGGLTLILTFPKAWFLLQIRRSNFCCFLHRAF